MRFRILDVPVVQPRCRSVPACLTGVRQESCVQRVSGRRLQSTLSETSRNRPRPPCTHPFPTAVSTPQNPVGFTPRVWEAPRRRIRPATRNVNWDWGYAGGAPLPAECFPPPAPSFAHPPVCRFPRMSGGWLASESLSREGCHAVAARGHQRQPHHRDGGRTLAASTVCVRSLLPRRSARAGCLTGPIGSSSAIS